MGVICVLVLLRTMVSSTRWPSKIGTFDREMGCSHLILNRPVVAADYPALEKLSESAVKEKQKFERLVVSKEKLLEMFGVSVWILIRACLNDLL